MDLVVAAHLPYGVQQHRRQDRSLEERVRMEASRIQRRVALRTTPRDPLTVWRRRRAEAEAYRGSGSWHYHCGRSTESVAVFQVCSISCLETVGADNLQASLCQCHQPER
jgi:hypothetical protein